MRRNITRAMLAALALFIAPAAYADGRGDAGPDAAPAPAQAAPATDPSAPAEGRSGVIPLGQDVSLTVPESYRYYSAAEAHAYLQRNNAAPPSGAVLGMVAPASADVRAPGTWATIVSYDALGYVQPETASGLSDAGFEAQVRTARTEQRRAFEGFLAAPAFDAAAPHVVWAERTAAAGAGGKDLRHEQKSLGRYGVATLTSIGSADQMGEITAAAGALQAMMSFPEGRRHGEFQAATDQVSAYSVPGLVTGVPTAAQTVAEVASTEGQTSFGGLAGWFPWIALGAVVLAIFGWVIMRNRKKDEEEAETA